MAPATTQESAGPRSDLAVSRRVSRKFAEAPRNPAAATISRVTIVERRNGGCVGAWSETDGTGQRGRERGAKDAWARGRELQRGGQSGKRGTFAGDRDGERAGTTETVGGAKTRES